MIIELKQVICGRALCFPPQFLLVYVTAGEMKLPVYFLCFLIAPLEC